MKGNFNDMQPSTGKTGSHHILSADPKFRRKDIYKDVSAVANMATVATPLANNLGFRLNTVQDK
jgi:hypothetical protein